MIAISISLALACLFGIPLVLVGLAVTNTYALVPAVAFLVWAVRKYRHGRKPAAALLGALAVGCFAAATNGYRSQARQVVAYMIPDGYIGQVIVRYGAKGAPALPVVDGRYILNIPASGYLRTSSRIKYHSWQEEYFYTARSGPRELEWVSFDTDEGMVRDSFGDSNKDWFFVGTLDQWRKSNTHAGDDSPGPLNAVTLKPLRPRTPPPQGY